MKAHEFGQVGLFLSSPAKYGRIFHWWLIAICIFVFIAGLGNPHPWYQLSPVPVAAAFAGRAFDFVLSRLGAFIGSKVTEAFGGVILVASPCTYVRPLYDPWATPLRKAGRAIDGLAPSNALAIFVLDGDSSGVYYSRRKGWHGFDDSSWGPPLDSEQAILGLEN